MATRGRPVGESRRKVAEWRERDPEATAAEIARGLGLSRERVRQHLQALGLPVRGSTRRVTRSRGPRARVATGGVEIPINTVMAGTIGELLAAADLSARGFTVYSPICRHTAHADLIALRRGAEEAPLLVEVRCGRRTAAGTVAFMKRPDSKCTHYAIVITGEPVIYDPPLAEMPHGVRI